MSLQAPPRQSLALHRASVPNIGEENSGLPADVPPPLEYTMRTKSRIRALIYFWTFVFIDSSLIPIALYFGLWYGTDLSPNTVFSIVTAAIGGISIFEYFVRFWRLWKKSSTCRVVGARRAYLDWFHWNYTFAWIIIMIELIVGSVPENPPIRLLSMPLATLLFSFGTEIIIIDLARYFKVPAPCRISSLPKGAQLRPGIYNIIEDVVAVDGSGGTEFRERLNARYVASHYFRLMIHRQALFWGLGAQAMAVLTTILVFTLSGDAAYVVGWLAPFVWASIWTLITFPWVQRDLRFERERWGQPIEKA